MRRWSGVAAIVLAVVAGSELRAAEKSPQEIARARAEEINNALITEDYDRIVELTHPKLVELMGGRKKMITTMESGTKDMKAKGVEIRKVTVDKPGEIVKKRDESFVVVPFLIELKAPGGKLFQKSYVIGVSNDRGKSWKFINGSIERKKIETVVPSLPEELKLPEFQKPVFEKD